MKMKTKILLLLALTLQLLRVGGQETWTVNLTQGTIDGKMYNVNGGRYYYVFRGIPYAKPPLGPLRFKDPEPPTSWDGVRNGTINAPACAQLDEVKALQGVTSVIGSEDCLYLNVFSPGPDASNLPVMFWIHGGAFYIGDAPTYEPNRLLEKDVVVVVIQYRLSIFGFLTTEDTILPGNLGLKDMVMALQWVKRNIRHFGGDANSVTIFGESVGGISVHYLMFLPTAKGLFHRVIAQSGVVLFPLIHRNDHRRNAAILGQMLSCSGVSENVLDSQALYDCLQLFNTDQLILASAAFTQFDGNPRVMMPWVDGDFIPEHPSVLVREGRYQVDIDFMTGITRDEGANFIRGLLLNAASIQALANNFTINGPIYLGVENEELGLYIAKRLFYGYLGDIVLSEENADNAVKMVTDYIFAAPMDMTAQARLNNPCLAGKTYLYELHHRGEFSLLDFPFLNVGKDWVSHTDDIQYLFSSELFGTVRSPRDLFMSEIIVSLWTNFARTGNPTPDLSLGFKWSPISGKELSYLILQLSPYMRGFTRQKELEFMKNLPMTTNRLLFPDCFSYKGCKRSSRSSRHSCNPHSFFDTLYKISVNVNAQI